MGKRERGELLGRVKVCAIILLLFVTFLLAFCLLNSTWTCRDFEISTLDLYVFVEIDCWRS